MAKTYYLSRDENGKLVFLKKFGNALPNYSGKYGIAAAIVTQVQKCAGAFEQAIDYADYVADHKKSVNKWKGILANGGDGNMPQFNPPVVETEVPNGIFPFVTGIVNQIKANPQYSVADGTAMGIEGIAVEIDYELLTPVIRTRFVAGGKPEIIWEKAGGAVLEIWRREEGGEWTFMTIDTNPDYVDKSPLPPSGVSKTVQYRAIYRYKDEQVGSWSDVISVSVRGV